MTTNGLYYTKDRNNGDRSVVAVRDQATGELVPVTVRDTPPAPAPYDPVTKPEHYRGGDTYETIRVIEAWGLHASFCLGNVVKYISRAGRKTPDALTDLKKAQWYLNREIERLEALRASQSSQPAENGSPESSSCTPNK